jgi:AcrR family transcriptional regulator
MPHGGRRIANDTLLSALACGATVDAAAQRAGVSPATVHRRLRDPEFCRRLQQLKSEIMQRTMATLAAASSEATKTLIALLRETMPPATRLGAARALLALGIKMRECDFDERLRALEERRANEGSPADVPPSQSAPIS